jgi:purine-binding chemotaxis protein CheW
MGRMAEARKRARRKKAPSGEQEVASGPPGAPSPEPQEVSAPAPPVDQPAAEEASSELVFPAEMEPAAEPGRTRITLPASGLASEILAQADIASEPAAASEGAPPAQEAPVEESPEKSHNISFFGAPQREEPKAAEATEHLVTFYLASEEYGVDVRAVQEIIRITEITLVPRAPEFIKGVINLRGRIIPVVDLKRKLNLGVVEDTRQARIVVVKLADRLIGLLVDGASQVLRVPVSSIEAAPDEVVEVNAHYLRGVAKLEARLVILLDLEAVLSLELAAVGHEAST